MKCVCVFVSLFFNGVAKPWKREWSTLQMQNWDTSHHCVVFYLFCGLYSLWSILECQRKSNRVQRQWMKNQQSLDMFGSPWRMEPPTCRRRLIAAAADKWETPADVQHIMDVKSVSISSVQSEDPVCLIEIQFHSRRVSKFHLNLAITEPRVRACDVLNGSPQNSAAPQLARFISCYAE